MESPKLQELRKDIHYLESELQFTTSMIGCLIAEANNLDLQIEVYTRSGQAIENKLRDLRAEMKDYE